MEPYREEKNGNIVRRTFANDVSVKELTWHRDREDRVVLPINENDWYIQMDNELPKKLDIDEEYFIPKNTYHRVIKGSTDLVVEVIKTTFEENEYEIYEVLEEGKKKKKKKKKDACYYKVKSRYDVWPSAYGSGALVKCRKVGAKNWGNSTDESIDEGKKWGKTDESVLFNEKSNIFVENNKNMILKRLHEMDSSTTLGSITMTDNPVKEPVVLPETKPAKPSRRKRIWEVKPAAKPKPKM